MNDRNSVYSGHNVQVIGREKISLTGIISLDSFGEDTIVMTVGEGDITVEGSELNITVLDLEKGCVEAEGFVTGIYYSDAAPVKKGLISRLLHG